MKHFLTTDNDISKYKSNKSGIPIRTGGVRFFSQKYEMGGIYLDLRLNVQVCQTFFHFYLLWYVYLYSFLVILLQFAYCLMLENHAIIILLRLHALKFKRWRVKRKSKKSNKKLQRASDSFALHYHTLRKRVWEKFKGPFKKYVTH